MRRIPLFVVLLSGSLLSAPQSYPASGPKYQLDALEPTASGFIRGSSVTATSQPSRRFGHHAHVGTNSAPGTVVGFTYADWQHQGSTGRQIDEQTGIIQVTFLDLDIPTLVSPTPVHIRWNRLSVTGSPNPITLANGEMIRILPLGVPLTVQGTQLPGDATNAYTSSRILPDSRGVSFYHSGGDDYFTTTASVEVATGSGVFGRSTAPQPAGVDVMGNPIGTAGIGCGDTTLHVIAYDWNNWLPGREVSYWRGVVTGAMITWDPPVLIDTVGRWSAVVEAHGDSVAVVYTKLFAPVGIQEADLDVLYRLSTDCGTTWQPAVNITDYGLAMEEAAWRDLDAVFDVDGYLHILWHTRTFDSDLGGYVQPPCHLYHWNSQRGTARRVTTADWSNRTPESCSHAYNNGMGSYFNTIAMMNLSVKPAGQGPGAGIPEELLYATWVQGGPTTDDCATQDSAGAPGGIVNAEIYMSVSSDDGFTWDRPQNLTGTRTPDCLPGDCHSEHWLTAAARADSGLYLSFVDDTHAGPMPFDVAWHGEWTESPYMVMAVEARAPIAAPIISVGPQTAFAELNAKTTGTESLDLTISNLGNAALNYDVKVMSDNGGVSHVLVNGGSMATGSVAAGGAPEVVTVEYDGIGLPDPSEWNWRLEVTSNDSLNDPGQGGTPMDVNLNVFVADTWYTCTQDTISTGQHRLAVSSCLELGDKARGGGLLNYDNDCEWLYDASPVIASMDGPAKYVYRDIHMNGLDDRSRAANKSFRAQSGLLIARDSSIVAGDSTYTADVASGVASSTDSLFDLTWEVFGFKGPQLAHGAVMSYHVTNRTDSTYSGIILGAAADFDVDSMYEANTGVASTAKQWIGARGGYTDTTGFVAQDYYAVLFYIPLDTGCADLGTGGQVLDNVDYMYPDLGYNTDSLYDVMARTAGWDASIIQADTASDVNVVLVDRQGATLGPNDTLEFAFGLAVSDLDEEDLAATIEALRGTLNPACIACPITLTGDVNEGGTITSADIIAMVNYVFKGGDAPQPCAAAGDVNCNGSVNSSDIIYLVNHVFKGQTAPCNVCGLISLGNWSCD